VQTFFLSSCTQPKCGPLENVGQLWKDTEHKESLQAINYTVKYFKLLDLQ